MHSNGERGTCTAPRRDSGAGPGGVSMGEPGEGLRAGELALLPTAGYIGWAGWGSTGELTGW